MALLIVAAILAPAVPAHTGCHGDACRERVERKHYQHVWRNAPAPVRGHLRAIARCESGGNHRAVSASGAYRGLLQFSYATWATVGGRGDPARASRWEQWARGVRLYRRDGAGQWPVCGR